MNKRDYLIGDIHGSYDELVQLIKACDSHCQGRARIISCGDLIDRGPKSKEVLDLFINNPDYMAIAGNHEQEFLAIYAYYQPLILKGRKLPLWFVDLESLQTELDKQHETLDEFASSHFLSWFRQGGASTLKSLGLDAFDPLKWELEDKYLDYLFSLPLFLESKNYFLSHALITKNSYEQLGELLNLEQDEKRKIISELLWNRGQENLMTLESKTFISGHTPFRKGYNSLIDGKVLQIDTGCCYGSFLTAWCEDGSIITTN